MALMFGNLQAPFFWLLVSLLAAIVGAGILPWDNSAERWLPDWLQSVDVQWRVVSTGLCVNFVGVLWLLGKGSGKAESKPLQSNLEVVKAESRAALKQTSWQSTGTAEQFEDSFSWMDFCCSTGRTDTASSSGSSVIRHNSYGGAIDEPVWLQDDSTLHPKFCGYRLKEPGIMPCLDRFPSELLGSNVPPHWEFMMPNCGDQERMSAGKCASEYDM